MHVGVLGKDLLHGVHPDERLDVRNLILVATRRPCDLYLLLFLKQRTYTVS